MVCIDEIFQVAIRKENQQHRKQVLETQLFDNFQTRRQKALLQNSSTERQLSQRQSEDDKQA